MQTLLIALVAGLIAPLSPQDSRPRADRLVDEAWQLLPAYTGEHRYFLRESVARDTQAAAHLLEAATILDPEHVRAFWSLGHAHTLLREDLANRGQLEGARVHEVGAIAALTRSMELEPSDPWALYSRATAYLNSAQFEAALADVESAIEKADALLDPEGQPLNIADVRFKSLGRRTEILTRARRFEEARASLTFYHKSFSTNDWPLHKDLGEIYALERDFQNSRMEYEKARQLFEEDFQAYAWQAYVAGLLDDREAATRLLQRAIQVELSPDLYTRLWLYILAEGDVRETARADLQELLDGPPSQIGEWDLRLGRFLLGAESVPDFVEAGGREVARRMEAGEAIDNLPCEVQFYAGVLWHRMADETEDFEASAFAAAQAIEHYENALSARPPLWKWEWAYSRRYLAELAQEESLEFEVGFELDGERFVSPELRGRLSGVRWHAAGAPETQASLERPLRVGDLLLAVLVDESGQRHWITEVVGVP